MFSSLFGYFKDSFGARLHTGLHDSLHMDDDEFKNKGYTPNTGLYDPSQGAQDAVNLMYTNVITGGIREADFIRGAKGFCRHERHGGDISEPACSLVD